MSVDDHARNGAQQGVAWLEALATQYEETAQAIRAAALLIRQAELASAAVLAADEEFDAGRDGVGISEAVRRALGGSVKPLKPTEVWAIIKATRIPLRTRSRDPSNLIHATLQAMERSKQVRKKDGGFVLTE